MRKRRVAFPTRAALVVVAAISSLGAGCPRELSTPTTGGSISVNVTLDGLPASGVEVQVRNPGGVVLDSGGSETGEINVGRSGVTGSGGTFMTSDEFPPGTYIVNIRPPEGADCTPSAQTVMVSTGGNVVASFTCTSRQTGTTQTGTINLLVTSGGSPLAGANVTLTGPGGTRTGATGSNGTVQFADLPPGQYTMGATATGQTCTSGTTSLAAGQTANVTMTCSATAPGSVTGLVTVDGIGASAVAVQLRQGTATIASVATSGAGIYQFSNVSPGSYAVAITPPAGATCTTTEQSVNVTSGQIAAANFACTLPPGSTFPTGPQLQGNWNITGTCLSQVGSCPPPLPDTAVGTMTFNSSNNTLGMSGFDRDVFITGPYNPSTGAYSGTGTRTADNSSIETNQTGTFLFNANKVPIFTDSMTRQHFNSSKSLFCTETYSKSAVKE